VCEPRLLGQQHTDIQRIMSDSPKMYELAYHLDANLEESQVPQMREELEKLVTSHGGMISFSKEPEKGRLSYEINHSRNSYFGYFQFSMPTGEHLAAIDEQLRLNSHIIRHLMIKYETPSPTQRVPRPATDKAAAPKTKKAPATEQEKKEIEQELDKVINEL
jgi:ribosomal protein S6